MLFPLFSQGASGSRISVFFPLYRLADIGPQALQRPFRPLSDIAAAYLYLIDELHIQPNKVALRGDSSGAGHGEYASGRIHQKALTGARTRKQR